MFKFLQVERFCASLGSKRYKSTTLAERVKRAAQNGNNDKQISVFESSVETHINNEVFSFNKFDKTCIRF